jgi:tight adherence protein B
MTDAVPILLAMIAAASAGAFVYMTRRSDPLSVADMGKARSALVLAGSTLLAAALAAVLSDGNVALSAVAGLVAALAVLQWRLYRKRAYDAAFSRQFLPALEVIVRGLQSGMPLLSALQVVQKEIGGPVSIEFKRLLDDLSLGIPMSQAAERFAARMPAREVVFFAHVISVQNRTGGRLSEALGNLADTLRTQQHFAQRVRTLSQEARSSAIIIGVIPLFVAFGLFLLSPSYITVLFTTGMGQIVLFLSCLWMGAGAYIMKRMIQIDA